MTSPYRDDTGAAIDLIDAALYSGDEFLDRQRRAALRSMLARWDRQLDELESLSDVLDADDEDHQQE
ncbi:response regulator transcription factor [Burkholderia phage vB_BglM_WTB]